MLNKYSDSDSYLTQLSTLTLYVSKIKFLIFVSMGALVKYILAIISFSDSTMLHTYNKSCRLSKIMMIMHFIGKNNLNMFNATTHLTKYIYSIALY